MTGRVLDGARLGVDVVDVTPPVILWLKAPVVLLARAVGWDTWTAWVVAVAVLAAISLLVAARLLRRIPSLAPSAPTLVATLAIGLFLLPGPDFGQREHLTIALTLPWILAAAARTEGQPVPVAGGWGTGLAAGLGLALKPHFALVWMEVAGVLVLRERRWRALLAPELVGAAAIPLLAVVATFMLHPGYFAYVGDRGPLYNAFLREDPLLVGLVGEGVEWSWLGLLALAAFAPAIRPWPGALTLLLPAMAAFHLAAAAQMKGWEYHFIPAGVLGLFLAAAAGGCARWPSGRLVHRVYRAAVPLGIAVAAWVGGRRAVELVVRPAARWAEADPSLPALLQEVRRSGRRERLLVVSTNLGSGWPLTHMAPADWTLRGPAAWPLAAIYSSELEGPGVVRTRPLANRTQAEQRLANEIEEDVALRPPTMVIVPRPLEAAEPWQVLFRFDYATALPPSLPGAGRDRRWPADTVGDYLVYRVGE
ncbi:MAG TPA: hypothetical protein VJ773_02475 [Gemmatimonadales bacterium]|nr:hypothetical protein [Gemmatimonadales bacterium]